MKLCKDCKHCKIRTYWLADPDYICMQTEHTRTNPVNGNSEKISEPWKCPQARDYGSCGISGRHWEAK